VAFVIELWRHTLPPQQAITDALQPATSCVKT